ncbi:hypothetical protein KOI35_05215 [Actinoplanes bogorensis]|uniref:Uncharacterized protein n=1 Tax=Paractinoplanes bogorensis TaxID=1610840 RepID=A0ABS5YHR9_9ACTN|nr:hypothetical protein [Actinoplanes bogorensis]MBU2662902.1 hypothetical protein [Actinoplanes bogorensis]
MIPQEDLGPAWLRDYGTTDFGAIEADIQAMEKFAAQLAANVQDSYAPHMASISESMGAELPHPPGEFVELTSFLTAHNMAQDVTHQNVYNYANGTQSFATAASEVSKQYSGTDAFSHARVSDVNKALDDVGIPAQGTYSVPRTNEGDL